MRFWQTKTSTYFILVAFTVVFGTLVFILLDSQQSSQTRASLTEYMENLRDMVFMSTYDSLKKGNMKLFKSHLEEIGTFKDVEEFSLLDTKGVIRYSSSPGLVSSADALVVGLQYQQEIFHDGFITYYFPVQTTSYCSRCHAGWEVGSVNSYYKLTLSHRAIDKVQTSTDYYHGFMALSGLVFVGFLFLLAVIYERKKYEEQRLLSASVRNFMDSVDDPFVSVDINGKCNFCNRAGLNLFGYENEAEIVRRNIHAIIQHTREDGKPVPHEEQLLSRMRQAGKSMVIDEVLLWRADGTYFTAECRLHPIFRKAEIAGATITFLDITKKKADELRTINLSHLASIGELAAGVAHEINNPISGVINYAQLYKNKYGKDAAGNELLDRIIKEGNRIASIVYSLLNYAHQGSDKYKPVNMARVVDEAMNLFRARLDMEGILLDVAVDESLPEIMGNFQNLEQVLMNLISNSRYALNKKYPENHHVDKILRIVLERADEGNWPHIRLTVFDHGTGIPEGMISKVMKPFFTTKPAGEGTGLGLHVCFNIIKQHNGHLEIESEPGEYTRVTISLPIEK